ncbi:MAG: archaetidylserine decarboxylase [Pseudomonadales bacterium]
MPDAHCHGSVIGGGEAPQLIAWDTVTLQNHRPVACLSAAERFNFLVTNRIPRRWLTLLIGWFSRIESPLLARISIGVWQRFVDDLRLEEAESREFSSLQACFTRSLRAGARPVDPAPDMLTSPCDAVVGEFGDTNGLEVIQAKGFPYGLDELLADGELAETCRDGRFVTLRLKSSMYHRFHAPWPGRVGRVTYVSGDTWNVNPVALKVVERLFCRNERAVIEIDTAAGRLLLVPVAAVLVACMRIHGLPVPLDLRYRGPNRIDCDRSFRKGEEMGWFEQGSTIILLTTKRFQFVDSLVTGEVIRMGQPLMRLLPGGDTGMP